MQESLSNIGAQISHDNTEIGRHGAVAWPMAVRETGHLDPAHFGCNGYEMPSFLHKTAGNAVGPNPRARFDAVFHQVRDPLKSIVSRANRIGMMYSPIAYANPVLFQLLTNEFRASNVRIAQSNPPPLTHTHYLYFIRRLYPLESQILFVINLFLSLYIISLFLFPYRL